MKPSINSKTLGIDLSSRTESQTFRWLMACLLFGKPIRQDVAAAAYASLIKAGITSLNKLQKTEWDALVTLLDKAHYVRYDFSTATKLLQVAQDISTQYGSVTKLLKQSSYTHDAACRLQSFKGVGPVTASIFLRDISPVWFKPFDPHDFAAAKQATNVLNNHGFKAYIIGGAVRDLWLGLQPKDFDLVTNATPNEVMALPEFKQSSYKDTAQAFGVTRVGFENHHGKHQLEIATFRKDIEAHKGRRATRIAFADLEDDVSRRDFTINALALDPSTGQIIDYVGGIDDLEQKMIRFIGGPLARIKEDPLRILRAIRFKTQLEFFYAPRTAQAIKKAVQQDLVETIAPDRLQIELTNLLLHPNRRQAVQDLDEFGIMDRILPEVTAGKGTVQPGQFHAEGDVWHHELLILDYLPPHPSKRLAWAALLHDIGKPPTATPNRGGRDRIRFNRHYAVGAELAKTVLKRLKFSNHDINDISWMVYNHMAIDDLPSMRPSHQQRMLGHPAFEDLLKLHRADAAASWRPNRRHDKVPRFYKLERLWHDYQAKPPKQRQPSLKRDLGIDGRWLLDTFNERYHPSGPLIGKVLAELEEWYKDQGVTDRRAYRRKARQLLEQTR